MKNKDVKQHTASRIPLNIQFFAEPSNAAGGDAGNGGGTGDAGNTSGDGNAAGTAGEGDNGGQSNAAEPKSFDDILKESKYQAEFDRRVNKALETQKGKLEVLFNDKSTEAEKLAKMTKDEKAQYLQQKHEKELGDREAEITKRELMAEAKNTLAEKKLPASLADVLNYANADSCNKSIDAVEKAFQEAVQSAVETKLKGGTPPQKAPTQETDLAKKVEDLMMGTI